MASFSKTLLQFQITEQTQISFQLQASPTDFWDTYFAPSISLADFEMQISFHI